MFDISNTGRAESHYNLFCFWDDNANGNSLSQLHVYKVTGSDILFGLTIIESRIHSFHQVPDTVFIKKVEK